MSDKAKDWKRRMDRACAALNAVLAEARKEHPNATLYLDGSWGLYLMSTDSHDAERDHQPNQHAIMCQAILKAGGGDW